MLKATLYGAATAGVLLAASAVTPAAAAPAAPLTPQVEKNATDVQHRHRRHRHYHGHHHHHHGYYGPRYHYYQPGPGIYFRAW